jgi:hypothetical protein
MWELHIGLLMSMGSKANELIISIDKFV